MIDRLTSLDAFRGITIAGMILVNNPGSWQHVYPPLQHAAWHGWTPTDLIFPFFLFIVGVAVTFSFAKQLEKMDRRSVYWKIIKRSAKLFALGLFLNLFPKFHFTEVRIPGVLQRIAICYAITSFIYLNTSLRQQIYLTVAILVGYWAAMLLIPVPGFGAGNLTVEGNLAAYIDNLLLKGHMWKESWDPEGILSTVPAIATTLCGVITGMWLRSSKDRCDIAGCLFVAGWMLVLFGLIWGIVFPINKALWTSSYVVLTAGCALQCLGFCYWLIDVKGGRRWAQPAVIYGMNAIAVFVLSGILGRILIYTKISGADGEVVSLKQWIYQHGFESYLGPLNGSLAYAIANVVFWLIIMKILYDRKIFIKV